MNFLRRFNIFSRKKSDPEYKKQRALEKGYQIKYVYKTRIIQITSYAREIKKLAEESSTYGDMELSKEYMKLYDEAIEDKRIYQKKYREILDTFFIPPYENEKAREYIEKLSKENNNKKGIHKEGKSYAREMKELAEKSSAHGDMELSKEYMKCYDNAIEDRKELEGKYRRVHKATQHIESTGAEELQREVDLNPNPPMIFARHKKSEVFERYSEIYR